MGSPTWMNERDLEAAFCGAVIAEAAAQEVGEDTEREHFTRHGLCLVFAATIAAAERLEAEGVVAVVDELRRQGRLRAVGGEQAVMDLVQHSSRDYQALLLHVRRSIQVLRADGRLVTLRGVRDLVQARLGRFETANTLACPTDELGAAIVA